MGPADRWRACRFARGSAAGRPGSGTAGSRARCGPCASSSPWMHRLDTPAASPHRSVDEASQGRRALRSDRTRRDLLLRRIDTLAPQTRDTLRHAALLGETFDLRVLAQLLGSPAAALTDLDDATAAAFIDPAPPNASTRHFTHALVRDNRLGQLPQSQQRTMHLAAVDEAEVGYRPTATLGWRATRDRKIKKCAATAMVKRLRMRKNCHLTC